MSIKSPSIVELPLLVGMEPARQAKALQMCMDCLLFAHLEAMLSIVVKMWPAGILAISLQAYTENKIDFELILEDATDGAYRENSLLEPMQKALSPLFEVGSLDLMACLGVLPVLGPLANEEGFSPNHVSEILRMMLPDAWSWRRQQELGRSLPEEALRIERERF